MPRVKCSHCGAGNQDATEQSECWQCGNILGAPPSRSLEMPVSPALNAASPPTQQLNPSLLNTNLPGVPGPRPMQAAAPRSAPLVLILTAVLIVAVIVLLAAVLRSS